MIHITKLNSSFLESCEYNPKIQILRIYLKGGKVYEYEGVSGRTYNGFLSAKSQGAFYSSDIKPNFQSIQITSKWVTCGMAMEDIKAGDQLVHCVETNRVKIIRLPEVG